MNAIRKSTLWVLTLVAGTGLGAAAITWSQGVDSSLTVPATSSPDDLSIAFREVATQALPAVVWIETHATPHTAVREETQLEEEGAPPTGEDLFRRFFGNDPRFRDFDFQMPDAPNIPQEGHGSGFIIDPSGIIMTNAHVVEGADKLIVHFYDGSEATAESWSADPRSDVAIVRVKAEQPLPVLALGNSDLMQVGDWVLAAGNPFDVGVTVTAGIISATGRGPGINERESYLQTDAAINPGNSGGPLLNLNGEVVGINTAISTSSGGYDGVGFTIPINMARWVAEQLIETGEVKRAYLGVALQEMSNELRRQFNVGVGQGALVSQVYPETPAAKAGIEEGDVIVEMADQPITDRGQLQGIVEALEIGQAYEAVVLRDGERVTLELTMEQMPGDFTPAMRRIRANEDTAPDEPEGATFDELGLKVEKVTPELVQQLGISEDAQGVVVTTVKEDSPAAGIGLQPGDVIEKVGSKRVTTPQEFREAVDALSLETGIALLITRGEASQFIVLKSE